MAVQAHPPYVAAGRFMLGQHVHVDAATMGRLVELAGCAAGAKGRTPAAAPSPAAAPAGAKGRTPAAAPAGAPAAAPAGAKGQRLRDHVALVRDQVERPNKLVVEDHVLVVPHRVLEDSYRMVLQRGELCATRTEESTWSRDNVVCRSRDLQPWVQPSLRYRNRARDTVFLL